jgi:hypothetical protein
MLENVFKSLYYVNYLIGLALFLQQHFSFFDFLFVLKNAFEKLK